jgi:hypothetical protein
MKPISNILNVTALTLVIISVLFMQGCKNDDPTVVETDRVAELLKANLWKMQSVMVDGTDQTTIYTGLTLRFTSTNYTTSNGGVLWPASGTWVFADATGKLLTRNDGLALTVEEITTTKLSLKLNSISTTLGGGRASSVSGNHTFVFLK